MKKKRKNKVRNKRTDSLSKGKCKNKRKMETATMTKAAVKTKPKVRDISSFKVIDQKDIRAVEAIKAGNKNAYVVIWNRYHPWFVQKVFHMVGSHDIAIDCANGILARAYEHIGSYQPTHTFNAWINFMFKNYMVDYSRKPEWKHRNLTVSMDNTMTDGEGSETSFSETIADAEASADSLTLKNEQRKAIREALDTLDETGRTLIGMFYGQQKTYEEISVELNMNEGSMKAFMFRAKQKIKEYISREYPELAMKASHAHKFAGPLNSEVKKIDGEEFLVFFAS